MSFDFPTATPGGTPTNVTVTGSDGVSAPKLSVATTLKVASPSVRTSTSH